MLANLRALFGCVVDIVLLRRGPEHLPASTALMIAVVVVYAIVSAITASQVVLPEHNWPMELLVATVTLLLWYHVALRMVGKRERYAQTMTAMFAIRVLFTPLLVPMSSAVNSQMKETATGSTALGILTIALFVWVAVIQVRIVRSAFEWPVPGAIAMVLAQEFFTLATLVLLIGMPAKPV